MWWCSATDWCYYGFTKFNPAPVSSRIDMMHNPGPYHIWKFRKFLRYLHCHIYLCIYDSNTGIISLCSDRVNSDLGLLPVFYWVFIPRPLGHWFGKCFGKILLIYDFFKPLLDTYICNSFTISNFLSHILILWIMKMTSTEIQILPLPKTVLDMPWDVHTQRE